MHIRIYKVRTRTWSEFDTVYKHGDGRGHDKEDDEDDDEPPIRGGRVIRLVQLS